MLRGNNGRGLKKGNRKGRKLIRCYLCGLLEPPSQGNSRRVCRIDPGQSQLRVREAGVFNHQVPTSHQLRAVSEDLNSQHPQCPAQELSTLLQPERGTQGSTLIASGSCQSPGSARPSLAPPWWGREGVPHHCWGRVKVQAAQGASLPTGADRSPVSLFGLFRLHQDQEEEEGLLTALRGWGAGPLADPGPQCFLRSRARVE